MTDARLQLILSTIQQDGIAPEDINSCEVQHLLDNEFVTPNMLGTMTHAYDIEPNQPVRYEDLNKYPPIDGLTAKGEEELKRLTARFYDRKAALE